MPNAWVEHVRKFAAKNGMSYGCAVSDAECKAKYHRQKARNAKMTRTPAQEMEDMGAEDVNVAEKPKKKKSMPDDVGKLIQDFARPTGAKSVIALFSNYVDGKWVLTEDNSVLLLDSAKTTPKLLYKGSSTKDAYDWILKNLSSRKTPLGRHQHTTNLLSGDKSDHELLEKYGLKLGNPSTQTRLIFYSDGDKRTIGDYITAMAGVPYTTKAEIKAEEEKEMMKKKEEDAEARKEAKRLERNKKAREAKLKKKSTKD